MKKLILKNKQELYYVKWQDAYHRDGWMSESELSKEINDEACIVEQVGWIVYEDKQELHLVGRRTKDHNGYGMYQRIPKAWIMKKKLVK